MDLNTSNRRARYTLADLRYLMARLRDPQTGCPWDLKQSFESIVHHTLEEAYEVADAIEQGDRDDMKEELGDLLFQVIFYARLGEEEGSFDFDDIADAIVTKLVRRHPHVFPDGDLRAAFPAGTQFSDDDIKQQWETIKQQERAQKAEQKRAVTHKSSAGHQATSILADIPANLPAHVRAEKLQRRAAQVGFDWPDVAPVFAKVEEELEEVREEVVKASGDFRDAEVHARLEEEIGDLLFCCINLARAVKVSPDAAMRAANRKFMQRFHYIEKALREQGKAIDGASLNEMDGLWDEAKRQAKQGEE